jgi:catalase
MNKLTHANGAPLVDNVSIATAGPRGPALRQDIWPIEKLARFDRELIPERRMHAKGSRAGRSLAGPAYGAGITQALEAVR